MVGVDSGAPAAGGNGGIAVTTGGIGGGNSGDDSGVSGGAGATVPVGECTEDPDSCTGTSICVDGACGITLPRWYVISVTGAEVPEQNPDAEDWDELNPLNVFDPPEAILPDVIVEVSIDGDELFSSEMQTNVSGHLDFELSQETGDLIGGSAIRVAMLDVDTGTLSYTFESMAECEFSVTDELLRSRDLTCSVDGSEVQASIVPR
jgi:hypothetical protein